jgi:hypothetical protein
MPYGRDGKSGVEGRTALALARRRAGQTRTILLFRLRGTEIERALAIVMTGGLVTSTILYCPRFIRGSRGG